MCGIAGKYFLHNTIGDTGDIQSMLNEIIHRGPDSEGCFSDGRALIGFRRLSIIDTTTGDQPLYNENESIVTVANGEIYNYLELKKILLKKGHHFKTKSDCEVIIHLYEEFGTNFVEMLNGMFAFCIYDLKEKRLILGRDRAGIKPLYYTHQNDVLVFSSEIKAILKAKEVSVIENEDVIDEYLCFRSLSGERTFFKNINLLSPGAMLTVIPSGIKVQRYWKPKYEIDRIDISQTVTKIKSKLTESVKRQLMSDVPLGTQLSGGVDSSWVSVLASRNSKEMQSFSVGFNMPEFNETNEAKIVAHLNGLKYNEIISDSKEFGDILPKIIWHNDEPLTHPNSVEIYNLCKFAKQHVKVLLTGEGADELFGGYPRYYICKIANFYNDAPGILKLPISKISEILSHKRGKNPRKYFDMTPNELVFWNSAFTDPHKVADLMDRPSLSLKHRWDHAHGIWDDSLDLMDNLLLYEFLCYLQPILLRQDKMSMAASIESRVPILDNEMINLAFSIPTESKIKSFTPKYIFKRAASKDLPRKIVYKRKIGFGVPVGSWMRNSGQLENRVCDLMEQRYNFPGINPKKLEKIISEHRNGEKDHQDILWPLINYSIWKDIFLK